MLILILLILFILIILVTQIANYLAVKKISEFNENNIGEIIRIECTYRDGLYKKQKRIKDIEIYKLTKIIIRESKPISMVHKISDYDGILNLYIITSNSENYSFTFFS